MPSQANAPDASRLIRGMGPWALAAFAINGTIGAGIFGLPAKLAVLAGAYSTVVIAACGLLIALVALCFAEVGSRFDRTGGPQLYISVGFGPAAGYIAGWLFWLSRVATCGAIANLLVDYAVALHPAFASPTARATLISTLTAAYAWLNIRGIREAAAVNSAFAVCKIVPLLAFAALGLAVLSPQALHLGPPPPAADVASAALLALYAYTGFEAPCVLAGEVRDAPRSVPFAILAALALVTLIYVLVQAVCVGLVPALASSERPLVDAAAALIGPGASWAVGLAAVVSCTGVFGAALTGGTRLLFAMADQAQLPPALGYVHPRLRTPVTAIVITAVVSLVLALTGSFLYLVKLALVGRVSVYAATCAVLPRLRHRDDVPRALFRVPAGSLVAWGCVLLLTICLARSSASELLDVALALAVGLGIFGLAHGARAARARRPDR